MDKQYVIPGSVILGLLRYLGQRPHVEVKDVVSILERLPLVTPEKKEDNKGK